MCVCVFFFLISTDMSSLTVFAHYDGQWNSNNNYVDFKMVGLLVPIDSNLVILKQLVANALETSMPPSDIILQYQVDPGLSPMKLDNDSAVDFYVELKKGNSKLTRFSLCITMNVLAF